MSVQNIPLVQLRESREALRTVNKETEEYEGLKDSIRSVGFTLSTITVRPAVDPETQESYFEVIDGAHRFNAAKDIGLDTIPCNVTEMDDDTALEAQIMANVHKIETKPAEYSRQLRRILDRRPMMTEGELAKSLGKSPSWIAQRLKLNKITNERVRGLINEGDICLVNAYALAGLPDEELEHFVQAAITDSPDEFTPKVNARVKEIREARQRGDEAKPPEFVATPIARKVSELKEELETGAVAAGRPDFVEAIKWALSLDDASIARQKADWEDRQAAKEANKKKRDAEKAQRKAEKLAEEQAEAAKIAAELNG